MSHQPSGQPDPSEYAEYYGKYVSLIPEVDVCAALAEQCDTTIGFLRTISEAAGDHRYAPGKWSIKEAIGHVIDTERVFFQRALFFARNSQAALPGYDDEAWAAASWYGSRPMANLIDEFEHVRRGNWHFFDQLSPEAWLRRGIGSDCEFTVRALGYIMAGHVRHHMNIMRERYL